MNNPINKLAAFKTQQMMSKNHEYGAHKPPTGQVAPNVAAGDTDSILAQVQADPQLSAQYGKVYAHAQQKGPAAVLAIHHTLLHSNPAYAQAFGGKGV